MSSDPDFAAPGPDAFDSFKRAYPRLFAQLARDGYEPAGPDVVGRCQGPCTLYLELCDKHDMVRGWVWDPLKFEFVGLACEVKGPRDKALQAARHFIESVFNEDQVSGSGERHAKQVVEELHVS